MSGFNRKGAKLRALLSASSCVSALFLGGVAYAGVGDDFWDDYSSILNPVGTQFGDNDVWQEAWSANSVSSEGAVGASALQLSQYAYSALDTAGGRISSDDDLGLNIDVYSVLGDDYNSESGVWIGSYNKAGAVTTVLDAEAGGDQYAIAQFGSASFDVTKASDWVDGDETYIGVAQEINDRRCARDQWRWSDSRRG